MTVAEFIEETFSLLTIFVMMFGMIVGSFLNVCIWRLPRGESLSHPPSHCPKCNHKIRPWENIPLLSWLFLRGKCSSCGLAISFRYPLIEMITGFAFLGFWLRVNSESQLPIEVLPGYFFIAASLIAITLIDIESFMIPNKITYSGLIVALVIAIFLPASHLHGLNFDGTGSIYGSLLSDSLFQSLQRVIPTIFASEQSFALVDLFLGAFVGGFMLFAVSEFGKRLWGVKKYLFAEQQDLQVVADGTITVGEELDISLSDLLFRGSDRVVVYAEELEMVRKRKGEKKKILKFTQVVLSISKKNIEVNGEKIQRKNIKQIVGKIKKLEIPREVLGLGDVKLLMMLGAFFGADAIIYIIFGSALLGSIYGVIRFVTYRKTADSQMIPFGPFIAVASYIWILAGSKLIYWYMNLHPKINM